MTETARRAFIASCGDAVREVRAGRHEQYLYWLAEVWSVGHDARAAFSTLQTMESRYGDNEVLRVGFTQPAADGTGLTYEYYWNPTNRVQDPGIGEIQPGALSRVLMKSDRPALGIDRLGAVVETMTLDAEILLGYASGETSAPPFPTELDLPE